MVKNISMWLAFLGAILLLGGAVQATEEEQYYNPEEDNGAFLPQVVNFHQDGAQGSVNLVMDANWTLYQFGNSGTNVSTTFVANPAGNSSILITDLYWVGDSFAVYFNDSTVGSSCLVEPNTLMMALDPDVAYQYGPWSAHCFVLPPTGQTTIVIGVNQSPFTGGAAAIKLVSGYVCSPTPRC